MTAPMPQTAEQIAFKSAFICGREDAKAGMEFDISSYRGNPAKIEAYRRGYDAVLYAERWRG